MTIMLCYTSINLFFIMEALQKLIQRSSVNLATVDLEFKYFAVITVDKLKI